MMVLAGVDQADFNFLRSALQLTNGNLSTHTGRLEQAGYVSINKSFQGKMPHTMYELTEAGRDALRRYWTALDEIRGTDRSL
jgi:DNA-binding PadR family transcriptional regulator